MGDSRDDPEERERLNNLCKRIEDEQNPRVFNRLLEELNGSTVEPRVGKYEVGLKMTRHYVEIFPAETPW